MKAFLLILFSWGVMAQVPNFKEVTPVAPLAAQYSSVASGDGRFVAVGNGLILYSETGGESWHRAEGFEAMQYNKVLYADGMFLAVGYGTNVSVSRDGIRWTSEELPPWQNNIGFFQTPNLHRVTYGNGAFVASTGPGGVSFTRRETGVWQIIRPDFFSGTFGQGRFLKVRQDVAISSTNGIDWVENPATTPGWVEPGCTTAGCAHMNGNLDGLTYDGTRFIGHGGGWKLNLSTEVHALFVSTNGQNWTFGMELGPVIIFFSNFKGDRLFFLNNRIVFLEPGRPPWSDHLYLTSFAPGLVDAKSHSFPAADLQAISFGGSNYVGVTPSKIYTGPNLDTWKEYAPPLKRLASVAVAGDVWVGVGGMTHGPATNTSESVIVISTNAGKTTQLIPAPAGAGALASVRHRDGKFIAVGAGGTVLRSLDGVSWSKRLSNTSSDLYDVEFGNGVWVAVGANGKVVTSTDGSVFSLRGSGTEVLLSGITFGLGKFVAVGRDGAVLTSSNGVDWNASGTEEALDLWGITFADGRFVATGTNGVVHLSADGARWQTVFIPGAQLVSRVAFGNGYFVANEYATNRFYYSTNGMNWRVGSIPNATLFGAEAGGGEIWLMGGNSALWKSSLARGSGPFLEARMDAEHRVVLTIDRPVSGSVQVLVAPRVRSENWQVLGTITNEQRRVEWTYDNGFAESRFFQVRLE